MLFIREISLKLRRVWLLLLLRSQRLVNLLHLTTILEQLEVEAHLLISKVKLIQMTYTFETETAHNPKGLISILVLDEDCKRMMLFMYLSNIWVGVVFRLEAVKEKAQVDGMGRR